MATSDRFPTAIVATFSCIYFLVFLLAIAGNSFVLFLCFKKRPQFPMKWFIANLAVADLAFITLSILDTINLLWTWIGLSILNKLSIVCTGFLKGNIHISSLPTSDRASLDKISIAGFYTCLGKYTCRVNSRKSGEK